MSKTVELAQHLQKLHINNMYKNDFYLDVGQDRRGAGRRVHRGGRSARSA